MVRREAPVLNRRVAGAATLTALVLALLLALAPLLPHPSSQAQFRWAAYSSHLAWFLTLMLFVGAVSGLWSARLRLLLVGVLATGVLVMALNLLDVPIASDIAKAAFGALGGTAFVRALERPWWLLPIAICVPIADAWSVFSSRGITNAVVEKAREEPAWIEWPTIAVPIAGLTYDLASRIGIVDVLFAAMFVGAAHRWKLGVRRAVVALAIGFVLTSVIVLEGPEVAVPALPVLCLAFLVAFARPLWGDARAARAGS